MAVVRTKYNTVPTSLLGKTKFYTNEKWSEHTHCPQARPQVTWPGEGGDTLLTLLIERGCKIIWTNPLTFFVAKYT